MTSITIVTPILNDINYRVHHTQNVYDFKEVSAKTKPCHEDYYLCVNKWIQNKMEISLRNCL